MSTTPPTPHVTVCTEDGCSVLIPATLEGRREHRRGHIHDNKVIDALRTANKDLNAKIAELARRLSGLETDVAHIEIPEQVEPLAILTPDDLEPLDDDELEQDDPEYDTASTYTADDYDQPAARADAIAAFTAYPPAIDRDDPTALQ